MNIDYGKSLHDGNDIDQTWHQIITSRYERLGGDTLMKTNFIQLIPNNNPFIFDEEDRVMSISTMIVCPYDIRYELANLPEDIERQRNLMIKGIRLIYKILEEGIQNTEQKRLRKERMEMQHFPHPHYHFCLSNLPLSQAVKGDRGGPLSIDEIISSIKGRGFFEAQERAKNENDILFKELQTGDDALMEKYVNKVA